MKDGHGSDQAGGTRGGENGVGCARRKAGSAERTDESHVAGGGPQTRGRTALEVSGFCKDSCVPVLDAR